MKLKRRALNRSYGGDLPINLFLIVCGLFMAMPMVYAVSSALKPLNELFVFPPNFFVRNPTLQNFSDMFRLMNVSRIPFSRYVFNTVLVSVLGTGGHVIVASLCAFALAKYRFRGSVVMFNMVVLALMFNSTVTQIPNFLIISRLRLMDSYLALIIPALASPLGLYLMKQFIEQMIPDTLLEAAEIDGAGKWLTFWRIVMPIVRPAWLTVIIFSFQNLWNLGASIYIQSDALKTLNYAVSQILAGGIVRTGVGAAATVFMMVIPILLFLLSQGNIVRTMATSGMKD